MTIPDEELIEILAGAAHEIGCDEPQTRAHLIHIMNEYCGDPGCSFCETLKKETHVQH